jgi:hypothetical protein
LAGCFSLPSPSFVFQLEILIMKRSLLLILALLVAMPVVATVSGCGGPTAQEKEWEKEIPTVPPGTKSKMPPAGEQPK